MAQVNQVTLDIDDEEPAEALPRNNTLHRHDSVSRQVPPNRNNLGLGDRLNSVFREIRPLVEQARMGNNARLSLPTWLPRNTPATHVVELNVQRPQSSIAHVNLGPTAQTYIVTERVAPPVQRQQSTTRGLSNSESNDSNLSQHGQEHPEINVSVNPANNNNIHDNGDNDSQSEDGTQQVVDVRATLNLLIRYAPFYLLLFIKFMYDCREGIFTFLILFFTFSHSNGLVRRVAPPVQRQQSTTRGLSNSESNDSNLSQHGQEHPEINVSVNPANNNNIHDNGDNDSQSEDGTQQVVDVRATLNLLIRYAPFYLLLFIKFMYDCREGIFTFLILFFTFSHSNGLVRREHGKQMNRSILALFSELMFTTSCIFIVHILFGHGKLLPNVVMFPGYTTRIDVWELLWLVVLTDLIAKIITVQIKILITMTPAKLLPFQKRGKIYLFTESVSQIYRAFLTIQPWMYFLMQSYEGSEKMLGMFLTSVYVVAKVIEILVRLRLLKSATLTLVQSVNLGTKPTAEQLISAGDSCPICHDDYATPVRLGCSHIFCELCISAWLDRDHTCPLCRAKVADEPTWRDGSTTFNFQLY